MTTSSRGAHVALLTVLVALVGELLFTSGALLDLQLREGAIPAAIAALATYAAPGIVVLLLVLVGRVGNARPLGRSLFAGVVVLAIARLALQAVTEMPRFVLGLATVAIALGVLVLAVTVTSAHGGRGARDTAAGLVLGLGLLAGLSGATGTWTAVWRSDVLGWGIALALVGAALWAAWQLRHQEALERPRGTWALGPFVAVGVFVLASPAFLASQSQVSPGLGAIDAGAALAIALVAVATAIMLARPDRSAPGALRLGALLPVLVGIAYLLPGSFSASPLPVLLVLLAGIPATALLLVAAFERPARRVTPGSMLGLGIGVGLGAILPLLIYQIDYDIPLGFPNALVIVAAAVLLVAASGVWRRGVPLDLTPAAPGAWQGAIAAPAAVVLVLGVLSAPVSSPADFTSDRTADTTLRVLNWNVHYGVTPEVAVDLEAFARAIEAEQPDVVALQEISRGWLLGGGTDIATWLSKRLDMGLVYAHAADRQFGNALLSKHKLTEIAVTPLPYGEGPMRRSAITATVTLADGTPVRVSSMHLQHKEENTATRLTQLDAAIADIVPTGPSVLAGDLNARPGWPEIDEMTDAGWVSSIDAVGDPDSVTFSTWDPVERIDWVFGQHVEFTRAEVLPDASSDHFAIVVDVVPAS